MQCSIISKIHTFKPGKYHYLAQTDNTKVPVISIHSETSINPEKQFTLVHGDIKHDWQDRWIEKQIHLKKIQNDDKAAAVVDNGALYNAVKHTMQELVDNIEDINNFGGSSPIKRRKGFTLNSVRGLLEIPKARNVRILCKIRGIERFTLGAVALDIYLAEAENTRFQIIDWFNRVDEQPTNYGIPMDSVVIFNNVDWSNVQGRAYFGFSVAKSYVLHSFNADMGCIINGSNPKYPIEKINQTIWKHEQKNIKKLDYYNIKKRILVQNMEEAIHKSSANVGTAYMFKVNAAGIQNFNTEVILQRYCKGCNRYHPITEYCRDAVNSNILLKLKGEIESDELNRVTHINVQYNRGVLQKMYTYFKRRRTHLPVADITLYNDSLGPNSAKTFVYQESHKHIIHNYVPLIESFFTEVAEKKDVEFLFSVVMRPGKSNDYRINNIEDIKFLDKKRHDNNNNNSNNSISNISESNNNKKREFSAVANDNIDLEPPKKKTKLSQPQIQN